MICTPKTKIRKLKILFRSWIEKKIYFTGIRKERLSNKIRRSINRADTARPLYRHGCSQENGSFYNRYSPGTKVTIGPGAAQISTPPLSRLLKASRAFATNFKLLPPRQLSSAFIGRYITWGEKSPTLCPGFIRAAR